MKLQSLVVASLIVFPLASWAQMNVQASRDSSVFREYSVSPISIEGEVENPGPVDLASLPLRSVPIKELSVDDSGKQHFKGAFYYTGYALYDILGGTKIKKANAKEFSPTTDLYLVVENNKGERAAFSWGEIFSARDRFQILVSRRVESINPAKMKTRWQLPAASRLVCADDLRNARFIDNPTKIVVRSFHGAFAVEKPQDMFAPEIEVAKGTLRFTVQEVDPSNEMRTYPVVGYGHGMGYKGVESVRGFVLSQLLSTKLNVSQVEERNAIVVVSSKDGYRAVFSASEIFNRSDGREFLLVDAKDSRSEGRFKLFVEPDFFVDRNVKAVEKIELVKLD